MRLWHKDLIDVLPQKQLCGQWRECLAIARRIKENGTPGHILVNRIMDGYTLCHFTRYCDLIYTEMVLERGYKPDSSRLITDVYPLCSCYNKCDEYPCYESDYWVFPGWHNDTYLRECLYNLEEKYLCGGIPQEQWLKVWDKYSGRFELEY